jgi:hypothetical protein
MGRRHSGRYRELVPDCPPAKPQIGAIRDELGGRCGQLSSSPAPEGRPQEGVARTGTSGPGRLVGGPVSAHSKELSGMRIAVGRSREPWRPQASRGPPAFPPVLEKGGRHVDQAPKRFQPGRRHAAARSEAASSGGRVLHRLRRQRGPHRPPHGRRLDRSDGARAAVGCQLERAQARCGASAERTVYGAATPRAPLSRGARAPKHRDGPRSVWASATGKQDRVKGS